MSDPDVLYRGEPVARLNDNELADGIIQPQTVTIYEVTDTTPEALHLGEEGQLFFGTPPAELPGTVRDRTVSMTPGFSDRLGTAIFFSHYEWESPGLTFHLDRSRLPEVIRGEYTWEFANEHPGWMARVETLADAEVRYDGQVVGLVNGGSVNKWGDRVRTRLDTPMYSDEHEWFAPTTGIELRPALRAVVSYVGTNSATKGSIDSYLTSYDGYAKGFGSGEKVEYMDEDAKLRAYHAELRDEMASLGDRLVCVLIEDQSRLGKADRSVRDRFVAATDGDGYVTNPDHRLVDGLLG